MPQTNPLNNTANGMNGPPQTFSGTTLVSLSPDFGEVPARSPSPREFPANVTAGLNARGMQIRPRVATVMHSAPSARRTGPEPRCHWRRRCGATCRRRSAAGEPQISIGATLTPTADRRTGGPPAAPPGPCLHFTPAGASEQRAHADTQSCVK